MHRALVCVSGNGQVTIIVIKKQHDKNSTSQPWFDAECIELLEWSILMLKIDTKEKFNYKGRLGIQVLNIHSEESLNGQIRSIKVF